MDCCRPLRHDSRSWPQRKLVTLVPLELARVVVAAEAGGASSSKEVAAAARRICDKLTEHLARLVGRGGMGTLLARSLTLTRATFPWVTSVGSAADSPGEVLQACLERQDADAAREALTAFVALFIGLLGRLIGDSLVARLLQELWPALPGARETM